MTIDSNRLVDAVLGSEHRARFLEVEGLAFNQRDRQATLADHLREAHSREDVVGIITAAGVQIPPQIDAIADRHKANNPSYTGWEERSHFRKALVRAVQSANSMLSSTEKILPEEVGLKSSDFISLSDAFGIGGPPQRSR